MKFIFYLLIFFQTTISISAYTENIKNNRNLKWTKIETQSESIKSNQIIWRSYNDDESYFKQLDNERNSIKQLNKITQENISNSRINKIYNFTEVEPFLPLNNFLNYGDFQSSVRWKSSFDGGSAGGTGQQNPSFVFDYGLSADSLISVYITGADDDLYNLVDGKKINYYWQSYALSYKKKLLGENNYKFDFSMVSTFEYWRHASGSLTSKSIYNQQDNEYGKDKFDSFVGALSFPFSKNLNNNFTIFIVPGITFLPEKLGEKGIGKNSYGNNFYLGSGFVLDIAEDLNLLFSYTNPLGPGNNYFDSNLKFSRKSIYSLGFVYHSNPKIGIEGKITNSYGSSPSTGLLTIPSDNLALYSVNIIYKPYEEDTFLKPLSLREKSISFGGITVNNALIPAEGTSQLNLNYDSKGNLFGLYGYSISNIFQLELLNIGNFSNINLSNTDNANLKDIYLDENNLNYRIAGKLMILSPQKDDLFWMSLKTTFGRNNSTNQGYLFSELINTFKLNDQVAFNLSPKYFFSGVESFGGVGVSSYINLLDNVQLIPEINTSLKNDSDFNSSLALRYSFQSGKSVDLYYSNAAGIQDIGTLLKDKEYRFGIKLNFLY